jgi:hypothetical protein
VQGLLDRISATSAGETVDFRVGWPPLRPNGSQRKGSRPDERAPVAQGWERDDLLRSVDWSLTLPNYMFAMEGDSLCNKARFLLRYAESSDLVRESRPKDPDEVISSGENATGNRDRVREYLNCKTKLLIRRI